jgi:hypothetical protein
VKVTAGQSAWSWKRQTLRYTALFIVTAFLAFIPFIATGKSFIWSTDGIEQHYIALQYYGTWLREIASGVIHGEPAIPLWDFGIGYGSDVLTTFAYYVIGDPLNLLSAIVPSAHTEVLYDALIVVRMFLAGLFFMVFCKRMGVSQAGALGGAIAFAFCSWALFGGLRHPFFLNPMVYLPLLLVGVEKIFAKESPVLFIVMIAISALSNFYFLYMLVAMLVVYVIVRFFGTRELRSVGSFFALLVKFIVCGVIGVAIAGVIFLPIVLAVVGSSRAGSTVVYDLLYPVYYYQQLIRAFSTSANSYYSLVGVAGPALLGVPALCAAKGRKQLKAGLIILTVFLIFPVFGSVLNGFSYVSNRWSWAYAMLLCFTLAFCWEDVTRPTKKTLAVMLGFAAVYALLVFVLSDGLAGNVFASMFLVLCVLVAIAVIDRGVSGAGGSHARVEEAGKWVRRFGGAKGAASAVLIVALVAGVWVNASFRYSPDKSESIDDFVDLGMAHEIVMDNPLRNVAYHAGDDGSFYRMGMGTPGRRLAASPVLWSNATVLRGISSTGFFWSLSAGETADYLMDMAIPNFISQSYLGLDHRTFLNELASVRYYVSRTRGETNEFVPYGYKAIAKPYELHERYEAFVQAYKDELGVDKLSEEQEKAVRWAYDSYRIDENQQPLPFGYTYTGYVDKAAFEAMNPAQRQEALMQGVVLEGDGAQKAQGELEGAVLESDVRELEFAMTPSAGVDMSGERDFTVDKESLEAGTVSIHLDVDIPAGCEAYVLVDGLEATELTQLGLYQDDNAANASQAHWNNLSAVERQRIVLEDRANQEFLSNGFPLLLKFACDGKANAISYRSDRNSWSTGQTVYMANLGYSSEKRSGVDMTFEVAGNYHFDDMKILVQPMSRYASWVDDLSACTLTDVEFGANSIKGSIEADEARVLLLSMPYSTGWSATIDGKPADLMRANIMFSGLLVEPGAHQVELHYTTPGLKYGLLCTVGGIVLLIIIALFARKKRRKGRKAVGDTLAAGKDGFVNLAKHRDMDGA